MKNIDKLICIGKNYADHIREMNEPMPENPVIFLKPASVLKQAEYWGQTLVASFPYQSDENIQPETEIVLQLSKGGYQMNSQEASSAIQSVALGLDVTLRSRQTKLKKHAHPWTTAKVFVDSAIISPWIFLSDFKTFMDSEFTMAINGKICQRGCANQMIMKPAELLVYISCFFPLCAGDLVFTGTPAGVTSVTPGSQIDLCWGDFKYQVVC